MLALIYCINSTNRLIKNCIILPFNDRKKFEVRKLPIMPLIYVFIFQGNYCARGPWLCRSQQCCAGRGPLLQYFRSPGAKRKQSCGCSCVSIRSSINCRTFEILDRPRYVYLQVVCKIGANRKDKEKSKICDTQPEAAETRAARSGKVSLIDRTLNRDKQFKCY